MCVSLQPVMRCSCTVSPPGSTALRVKWQVGNQVHREGREGGRRGEERTGGEKAKDRTKACLRTCVCLSVCVCVCERRTGVAMVRPRWW